VTVLLDQVSAIAEEIVCVVDSRVPLDELRHLDARADLVVRCEFDSHSGIERNLAWLHGLCSGQWILRIDSDEVLSSALLDALPSLLDADDVAQIRLRRLWVYPDVEHVVADAPWSDDWQNRLVRNVPFALRFPGLFHSSVESVTPYRFAEEPMYHLDCVIHDVADRTKKAEHYLSIRPDVGMLSGKPANDFYLPEKYPDARLRPVTSADVPLLRSAVAAFKNGVVKETTSARKWRWGVGEVPVVDLAEVDRSWALRELPESSYRCEVEILDDLGTFEANESRVIEIRVRNLGTERWPYGDQMPEIRLGHRWFDDDGTRLVMEGQRCTFTADVLPGTSALQTITVRAPSAPGKYLLELNVLHEHHRWFDTGVTSHVEVVAERYEEEDYGEEFYALKLEGMLSSAREVLGVVLPMISPTSVVDVGCGEGAWLSVCNELGIHDVVGLDGPWVHLERLQISEKDFLSTDISLPIQLDRQFDLTICLEVAEHLDAEYADTLVESIAALAPAVLFSAALPGQGGAHHVNEQWPEYWLERFEARGFECFDVVRPLVWTNPRVEWWYCQNTFLLLHQDHPSRNSVRALVDGSSWPRALVHPRAWQSRF
jgi:SAM-dependent methyltransferase